MEVNGFLPVRKIATYVIFQNVFFACGLCRNNTAAYTNTTWGWHSNGRPVRVDLTMDLLQKWDFSGCALSAPIAVGQPLGQP